MSESTTPPTEEPSSFFRFRLLHVFLFVAVLAVFLGYLANRIHLAMIQLQAVANLEFTGWETGYDGRPLNPISPRDTSFHLWHPARIARLNRGSFPKAIPHGQLQNLARLTNLEQLHLGYVKFEAADFHELAPLVNIQVVQLRTCDVGGEAIEWLERLPSLHTLHFLDCSPPTDRFLQAAPGLAINELTMSHLDETTAEAIARMPRLTRLNIDLAGDLAAAPIDKLARSDSIQTLRLTGCNIPNESVQALIRWKKLQALEYAGQTNIAPEGWAAIGKDRPDLKIVHISGK